MKTMNILIFTLLLIALVLPLLAILSLLCYAMWYTLNSNSGIRFAISWQGNSLITWELQNTAPDWKDMQKQFDNNSENSG